MDAMRRSFYYLSLFTDVVILVISFFSADFISRNRLPEILQEKLGLISLPETFTILLFLIIWFFSAKVTFLYDDMKNFNFLPEFFAITKNVVIQLVTGVLILFSLKNILLSRFFMMLYLAFLLSGILLVRVLFRMIRRILIRKGSIKKNVIVIGSNNVGNKIIGSPEQSSITGYNLIGFVADDPAENDLEYLGKFKDIGNIIEKYEIDEVLIALNGKESGNFDEVMKVLTGFPVRTRIIPEYFRFISSKYQFSFFNNVPVIDVRSEPLDELHWRIVKRGFDIVFSFIFLIFVFSWMGILIALIIKISSRGPVFFKQERWGRKNKKFILYKFRSMVKGSQDLDKNGKFIQATKDDMRVTPFGKFLRRSSFDELPQFFNVLKGDMSVIGPRPHAVPMNIESKDNIDNYMLRHLVKPGITGWAQVSGFRGATSEKKLLEKRIQYDMFYIENWSFWFDIRIIFLTVWRGIKGDPNAY